MPITAVETDRIALVRERLNTPVLGDVLDQLGRVHQFLPAPIRALAPGMTVAGRAMPVLVADVFGVQQKPFGRLTEALDSLAPGDVYIARGSRTDCAAWGEILTATARTRGAAGAIIDGFHRDTDRVLAQGWPVFSRGAYGQDAGVRAAVTDVRVAIEVGQVTVNPGDLVVGDADGVLVVPRDVEDEALERAFAKIELEHSVRESIESGSTATAAFDRFGVL